MARQLQSRPLLRTVSSCRHPRQTATWVAIAGITLVAGQAAEISSGSGVAISAKGDILTNAHVVEGCQSITVKLAAGITEAATLVANDERNDLALVRLRDTASPLPSVAVLREGSPVRAGDTIVALGYPLSGLLSSDANLSVGNVSALAGLHDDTRYLQISARAGAAG
jgi:S1-C subfamily serine protease